MRSELVTAALVAFLLLACAGVGLAIGGSSGGGPQSRGSTGGGGSSQVTTSETERGPPKIVVRAVTFELSTSTSNSTTLVQTAPLAGVQLVFTQQSFTRFLFGHAPFYVLFTNSSGEGQTFIPEGNYTVVASGTNFNYTTAVSMKYNTITYLDLKVEPGFFNVTTLEVSNPDSALVIEPTAQISAEVAGEFHYSPYSTYQLVGGFAGTQTTPHGLVTMGVTVTGSYPAPGGTWVQLEPIHSYQSVPSSGVVLVQYLVNSTVSYSGV